MGGQDFVAEGREIEGPPPPLNVFGSFLKQHCILQIADLMVPIRVSHLPLFISDYISKYLIWSPIISGYPKHIFFFGKKIPKVPPRPP